MPFDNVRRQVQDTEGRHNKIMEYWRLAGIDQLIADLSAAVGRPIPAYYEWFDREDLCLYQCRLLVSEDAYYGGKYAYIDCNQDGTIQYKVRFKGPPSDIFKITYDEWYNNPQRLEGALEASYMHPGSW